MFSELISDIERFGSMITSISGNIAYNNNIRFTALPKVQKACKAVQENVLSKECIASLPLFSAGIGLYRLSINEQKNKEFENCLKFHSSKNVENFKEQLLKFLKKECYDTEFIDDIENAETKNDIDSAMDIYINSSFDKLNEIYFDETLNLQERILNKDFDENLDKQINSQEIKFADKIIPITKLLSQKDSSFEILEIKNELKNKYGVELYFDNKIENVKAYKEAIEILTKNNIPPCNTIFSDKIDFPGICLDSSDGSTVIINPNHWQMDSFDSIGLILHETIHSIQPKKLEFRTMEIPEEFKSVANGVSEYARDNFAHEVHCELYVKKLINGLTKEEDKLFNILGGEFINNRNRKP